MTKRLLNTGPSGPAGWSASSELLRCPRRWRLNTAGFVEGDREALIKGTLVHVGLAHHYARTQAVQEGWTGDGSDGKPLGPEAYHEPQEAIALVAEANGESWLAHKGLAQRAVSDYTRRVGPEHVVAVEHLVECPVPRALPDAGPLSRALRGVIPEVIVHRMRLDLILKTPGGRYLIRDHKTSSNPKAGTASFELSGQIIAMQWWGQRAYGDAFAGVEIGSINLTTSKLDFSMPRPAPHAVQHWPATRTWIEVQRTIGLEVYGDSLAWPMALSDQGPCMDRYGPCGYRDSCRLGLPERSET